MDVGLSASVAQSFSAWSMFWHADWVVKGVLIILVLSSLWSWSIIFSKILSLRHWQNEAEEAENSFNEHILDAGEVRLMDTRPFVAMVTLTAREWYQMKVMRSLEARSFALKKLEQLLWMHIEQQREDAFAKMNILASVASVGPFVGLFGTVWGIMNSFQSIAMSQNTSIAVVAPGISEALFVTAVGLGVAIPAFVAYNRLSAGIQQYIGRMESFSQVLLTSCMRPLPRSHDSARDYNASA